LPNVAGYGVINRRAGRVTAQLLSGEKPPRLRRSCAAESDPLRHFAAADYCIAKASFGRLVGAAEERERH
jgi:hypothetical protein